MLLSLSGQLAALTLAVRLRASAAMPAQYAIIVKSTRTVSTYEVGLVQVGRLYAAGTPAVNLQLRQTLFVRVHSRTRSTRAARAADAW
jgi:hypothetical protein